MSHLKVAIALYNRKNLYIWPEDLKRVKANDFFVCKNSGRTRNDSGLSLLSQIVIKKNGMVYRTLFPGDAQYKYIPSFKAGLDALVVTHHGGMYKGDIPPMPNKINKLVYSYGINNTYNHPAAKSISKHQKLNWNKRLDTINGHVLLGPATNIPIKPCIGNCSLDLIQV
ncbi:hypothetical protein ACM6N5_00475 [Rossellomorea marisflavi]|uniref:hypothetical protein n=1 Tax=Rossellomorea marisflavi TaxID=189381 RepID=UPI003AEE3431